MEAAQVSVNRWVGETTRGRYTMEYYSAIDKEKILPFANDMDGSGEHYAKGNKPVRERQISCDFTHMWNLMNKLN